MTLVVVVVGEVLLTAQLGHDKVGHSNTSCMGAMAEARVLRWPRQGCCGAAHTAFATTSRCARNVPFMIRGGALPVNGFNLTID